MEDVLIDTGNGAELQLRCWRSLHGGAPGSLRLEDLLSSVLC